MARFFRVILVAVTIVVAIMLYAVKYNTGQLAIEIINLDEQIAIERESIGVLRAEWSKLNQPARLQHLAGEKLTLLPVKTSQIKTYPQIPKLTAEEAMADLVNRSLTTLSKVQTGER